MNNKYKLALIFGGKGLEHSVSVKGAEFLYENLDRELFDPIILYVEKNGGKDRTDQDKGRALSALAVMLIRKRTKQRQQE